MSLLERLGKEKKDQKAQEEQKAGGLSQTLGHRKKGQREMEKDPHRDVKEKIHQYLVKEIDEALLNDNTEDGQTRLRTEVSRVCKEYFQQEKPTLTPVEFQQVMQELIDEVTGFGPITRLLNDDEVSEVMVNGPNQVYVERKGKLVLTDVKFRDDRHVKHIIDRIVAPIGRRIDEAMPMVDARLPDGSRVNAIIPPLALNGSTLTIRKFSRNPLTVDDLIRFGSMTPEIALLLEACVKVRLNIVVSGGTGSGKTTLLNVLSSFIPEDERIVTIEDAAELQLNQDHVVSLETRPANVEGKGAITIRDLVKNCLRMRPDRVVVGEVRGGEALDMLQAMNTGHDGSLTTGHANSPRDMLARLETMVLMSGMDLSIRAIREQVASAVDVIVQQSRLKDGSRRIVKITEVQGMEGDVITLQDIFIFRQDGIDENGKIIGKIVATGIRPKFYHKFEEMGVQLPPGLFQPEH